jgi:hypothetical protein
VQSMRIHAPMIDPWCCIFSDASSTMHHVSDNQNQGRAP